MFLIFTMRKRHTMKIMISDIVIWRMYVIHCDYGHVVHLINNLMRIKKRSDNQHIFSIAVQSAYDLSKWWCSMALHTLNWHFQQLFSVFYCSILLSEQHSFTVVILLFSPLLISQIFINQRSHTLAVVKLKRRKSKKQQKVWIDCTDEDFMAILIFYRIIQLYELLWRDII